MPRPSRTPPPADAADITQEIPAAAAPPRGLVLDVPKPPLWLIGIAVGVVAGLVLRQLGLPPWQFPVTAKQPLQVQLVNGPAPNPNPPGPGPQPTPTPFPGLAEQATAAARSVPTPDLKRDAAAFADALDKFTGGNRSFADVLDVFRQLKVHQSASLPPDTVETWRPFSKAMGGALQKLNLQTPAEALRALGEISRGLRAV